MAPSSHRWEMPEACRTWYHVSRLDLSFECYRCLSNPGIAEDLETLCTFCCFSSVKLEISNPKTRDMHWWGKYFWLFWSSACRGMSWQSPMQWHLQEIINLANIKLSPALLLHCAPTPVRSFLRGISHPVQQAVTRRWTNHLFTHSARNLIADEMPWNRFQNKSVCWSTEIKSHSALGERYKEKFGMWF